MQSTPTIAQPIHAHRSPGAKGHGHNRQSSGVRLLMANLVALCDQQPQSKLALAAAAGVKAITLNDWLHDARTHGQLVFSMHQEARGWMTPRCWQRHLPGIPLPSGYRSELPTANVPMRFQWASGAQTVEHVNGVRVTRQAAPPCRFAIDAGIAGKGAISADWAARRRGQKQASRVPALTGGTRYEAPVYLPTECSSAS